MNEAKQNRGVVEFLTIAAEYCAFVEQSDDVEFKEFIDKSLKILSLLYLKASLLPDFEEEDDAFVEKYVTEQDWNLIHTKMYSKFGEYNSYFDITQPEGLITGEKVNVSIAEAYADIFQDLRDLVQLYRESDDEGVAVGVNECKTAFRAYWGVRLIGLLQELHVLLYNGVELES